MHITSCSLGSGGPSRAGGRGLAHQSQRVALGVGEERHPFLGAVVMAADEVRRRGASPPICRYRDSVGDRPSPGLPARGSRRGHQLRTRWIWAAATITTLQAHAAEKARSDPAEARGIATLLAQHAREHDARHRAWDRNCADSAAAIRWCKAADPAALCVILSALKESKKPIPFKSGKLIYWGRRKILLISMYSRTTIPTASEDFNLIQVILEPSWWYSEAVAMPMIHRAHAG